MDLCCAFLALKALILNPFSYWTSCSTFWAAVVNLTISAHLFVSFHNVVGSSHRSGFWREFLCHELIFHFVASLRALNQGHSDSLDTILVIWVHLRDAFLLSRANDVGGSQLGWAFICRFWGRQRVWTNGLKNKTVRLDGVFAWFKRRVRKRSACFYISADAAHAGPPNPVTVTATPTPPLSAFPPLPTQIYSSPARETSVSVLHLSERSCGEKLANMCASDIETCKHTSVGSHWLLKRKEKVGPVWLM